MLVIPTLIAKEVAIYLNLLWITHLLTLDILELHAKLLWLTRVNLARR